MLKKSLIIFFTCLTLSSCLLSKKMVIKNKNFTLKEQDFNKLKGWQQDNHLQALESFLNSCKKMAKLEQNQPLNGIVFPLKPADYYDVCQIGEAIKTLGNKQAKNFFENWFRLFSIESKQNHNLITGYYEALLYGSYQKTSRFRYPVYTMPNQYFDFNTTRERIENGALNNKKLELLFVDNDVDLFFTHIQGSALVILPDGKTVRLVYAGRNNHQFTPIANYLLTNNLIKKEEANPIAIKKWLNNNPDRKKEVFNFNPLYIFFALSSADRVFGAFGTPLMSQRSVAIDDNLIGYGNLLWVFSKDNSFSKLMVAQDTGSAIKGIGRADVFFGSGIDAEEKASSMFLGGKYYLLLPSNSILNGS
jgi:membrane-bound lytic murein transglycosylase A